MGDKGICRSFEGMLKGLVQLERNISIINEITSLDFPSWSYNNDNFKTLNLRGFPLLKTISIDRMSFRSLSHLVMESLHNVTTITVGESSFEHASLIHIAGLVRDQVVIRSFQLRKNHFRKKWYVR